MILRVSLDDRPLEMNLNAPRPGPDSDCGRKQSGRGSVWLLSEVRGELDTVNVADLVKYLEGAPPRPGGDTGGDPRNSGPRLTQRPHEDVVPVRPDRATSQTVQLDADPPRGDRRAAPRRSSGRRRRDEGRSR